MSQSNNANHLIVIYQINMSDMINTVYGLFSTRDSVIRYVGQTEQQLWRRFAEHLKEAAEGVTSEKALWMKRELNDGYQIQIITMLENCKRSVDERRMLDVYELAGHPLTNTYDTQRHKDAQRRGIEKAKAEGRYKGRPAAIEREPVLRLRELGVTASEIARRLVIGRASVYRIFDEADKAAVELSNEPLAQVLAENE